MTLKTVSYTHLDVYKRQRLDIVGARNVSSVVSEHAEMLRILREKDLDAIEPLMRTHLYGGVSRMGSKVYSDEYRVYFKLPEGK